jgi:hypothetical protein
MGRLKLFFIAIAAFACCVVVGPVGSAFATPEFEAGKYPATIKGENTTVYTFATNFGTFTCSAGSSTGAMTGNSNQLALSPSLVKCTGALGLPAVFVSGGCEERHALFTGPPVYGSWSVTPPGCVGLQLSFPAIPGCTVTIPPQPGLSKIDYVMDEGPPVSITSQSTISGVKYVISSGCGTASGTFSNGVQKVKQRLKAFFGGVQTFFRFKP